MCKSAYTNSSGPYLFKSSFCLLHVPPSKNPSCSLQVPGHFQSPIHFSNPPPRVLVCRSCQINNSGLFSFETFICPPNFPLSKTFSVPSLARQCQLQSTNHFLKPPTSAPFLTSFNCLIIFVSRVSGALFKSDDTPH